MINHRISRDQMLLEMAFIAAKRGTCGRLSVGAIIARDSRPISLGYVGPPSGELHCWEADCDRSKPCTRTLHAERNAITHAHSHGIGIVSATMYCTDSPCWDCAQLIEEANLDRLVYAREYRDRTGIIYLQARGIHVHQVDRAT